MGDKEHFSSDQLQFLISQFDKVKEKLSEIEHECRELKNLLMGLEDSSGKTFLERVIIILTSLASLIMSFFALYQTLHN